MINDLDLTGLDMGVSTDVAGMFGGGSITPLDPLEPVEDLKEEIIFPSFCSTAPEQKPIKLQNDLPNVETAAIPVSSADYQDDCLPNRDVVEALNVGSSDFIAKFPARLRDKPKTTSTGIPDLDYVLGGGIPSSGLVVVAAMPNVGKTTILLQSAAAMAKQGVAVVFLSHDMREMDIVAKVVSSTSYQLYGEDCYTLNNILDDGVLSDGSEKSQKVLEELSRTQKLLAVRDLIYDPAFDAVCATMPELLDANRIQKIFNVYCSIYKKVVFIVDSLQQVAPAQKGGAMDAVDRQLREFKSLSTYYDVPIILISTLNRSSYSSNKDLDMTALKQSGSIEFDADSIVILQPSYIKGNENVTMDEFRSMEYRDITAKSIKSRTCGYREKTMTLYAPGCTFIEYSEERNKAAKKKSIQSKVAAKKVPDNSNFS